MHMHTLRTPPFPSPATPINSHTHTHTHTHTDRQTFSFTHTHLIELPHMAIEVALGVLIPLAGGDLALFLHRFLLGLVQGLGLSSISFNFVQFSI